MEKYLSTLRACTLFSQMSDVEIKSLMSCLNVKVKFFDKNSTIIAENTQARYIGIVLSGTARIIQIDYYGNRSILSEIYPSELFGEAFACAEVESIPVTVIANEPCEVMLIDISHILHTCGNNCVFHQQLIFNLMKTLATKNIRFHQKIDIISKRSTREKLMTYLMYQARKAGCNSFEIPFDRQELADYLEVDRSGLSAEISKLRKEGVLESYRKRFELK